MPDHWHALFALREPWTLPKFMHDMMSLWAQELPHFWNGITPRGKTATTTLA